MSPPEDLIHIYIYPIECPMEYPVDKDLYREKSGVSQDLMIQPLNCRVRDFYGGNQRVRKPTSRIPLEYRDYRP